MDSSSGKESTGNSVSTVHLSQKSPISTSSSTVSPTTVSGNVNSTTTVSASAVSSTGISQNLRSNSYVGGTNASPKKTSNSIDKVVNNTKVNSVHHNDSHTVAQSPNVPASVASVNQKGPTKVSAYLETFCYK